MAKSVTPEIHPRRREEEEEEAIREQCDPGRGTPGGRRRKEIWPPVSHPESTPGGRRRKGKKNTNLSIHTPHPRGEEEEEE